MRALVVVEAQRAGDRVERALGRVDVPAAVTQLGQSLRAELAGRGVRVTTIEPGLTSTELGDHVEHPESRAVLEDLQRQVPSLSAADVADLVAYVTSRPQHVPISPLVVMPTRQAAMAA